MGDTRTKESHLADGRKKLQELAAPVGSYTINMIDLAAVDDKYKDLKVKIRRQRIVSLILSGHRCTTPYRKKSKVPTG